MSAVIILGAGASKGARLATPDTPPLDAEFLSVARKLPAFRRRPSSRVLRNHYAAWVKLNSLFRSAGLTYEEVDSWRLEQLSTFLEARATLTGLQLNQGRPIQFRNALEALKSVVSSVLTQRGGGTPCLIHRALFKLTHPSAVVTFNYDLIADQTLAELGLLKWDAAAYRGSTSMRAIKEGGARPLLLPVPAFGRSPHVPLYKLHGSINWERIHDAGHGHRLAGIVPAGKRGERLSAHFQPKSPLIIPPVAAKVEIPSDLGPIWKGALSALYGASSWIFWGYSFPQTDTISQVLFRTALERNRASKPVIVINPDRTVAARVKEVCRKVKVFHYPSMERYLLEKGGMSFE